jgi:5-hydroxyisourate hydrolase
VVSTRPDKGIRKKISNPKSRRKRARTYLTYAWQAHGTGLVSRIDPSTMQMSVSVYVVDCTNGCAAADMSVRLYRDLGGAWEEQTRGRTNAAGHLVMELADRGTYQIECDLDGYFAGLGATPSYPRVNIIFRVSDAASLHAIPLFITPHAYGTYRKWQ